MLTTILALLLEGFVVLGLLQDPSISLKLNPTVGFAPFSTRGTVTIPPHPSNRDWCLVWASSEGESGLSCKPLEGERAPKTHQILLKDLSEGEYEVYAELGTIDGVKVSSKVQMRVLGRE